MSRPVVALTSQFAKQVNAYIVGPTSVVVKPNELASALDRPRNTAYYQPGLPQAYYAATLAYGVIMGHPFMDGNKRTAFWIASEYLRETGAAPLTPPGMSVADSVSMDAIGDAHSRVAQGQMDVEGLFQVYSACQNAR